VSALAVAQAATAAMLSALSLLLGLVVSFVIGGVLRICIAAEERVAGGGDVVIAAIIAVLAIGCVSLIASIF
jgi:hypothetical protein